MTRGEERNLPVYGPGGLVWRPRPGDQVLVIKAANSLGVMNTDTYVCLFDMDSGKSWYDLEGYAADMADGAWGSAKTKYMDLESEALLLGAAIRFRSFTREEVQRLIASVTG